MQIGGSDPVEAVEESHIDLVDREEVVGCKGTAVAAPQVPAVSVGKTPVAGEDTRIGAAAAAAAAVAAMPDRLG